jgi:DNA-binding response OmpR family regulator
MSLANMAAALEAENAALQAEVAMLRQRLAMAEPDSMEVQLMVEHRLTRGEAALLTRLISAKPRAVDRYTLEAAIPARDHAGDRNVKIVDVLLCKLRKKLGREVIQTLPGVGWRIAPDWKN